MGRRIAALLFTTIIFMLAGGCTSGIDIQNNAYATAIGIDYKSGKWVVYAQVVNFSSIAHTEQVEIGKSEAVWIGLGRGDTVASAMTNVGEASQLKMFWGHAKAVVITEEALKKDVKEIFSAINRYREVRYTVYVYGTDMEIKDVLTQKSILNLSPLYTKMFTGTQTSAEREYLLPIMANRAIARLDEPGETATIPSIGVDTGNWFEDKKPRAMFELTGAYFFRGNQLSTWMSVDELIGTRWAEKKLQRAPLLIRRDGKPTALLILSHPRMSISVVETQGETAFRLRIRVTGYVMELMLKASIEEMEEEAAQAIAAEVTETFRAGLKHECDPFGLLEKLYRSNPERFHEETSDSDYSLTTRSLAGVDVDVKLVNTGKYQGNPP